MKVILGGLTFLPHFLHAIGVPMKLQITAKTIAYNHTQLAYVCYGFMFMDGRTEIDKEIERHKKFWDHSYDSLEIKKYYWGFVLEVQYYSDRLERKIKDLAPGELEEVL
jgi:hypothetical protein